MPLSKTSMYACAEPTVSHLKCDEYIHVTVRSTPDRLSIFLLLSNNATKKGTSLHYLYLNSRVEFMLSLNINSRDLVPRIQGASYKNSVSTSKFLREKWNCQSEKSQEKDKAGQFLYGLSVLYIMSYRINSHLLQCSVLQQQTLWSG